MAQAKRLKDRTAEEAFYQDENEQDAHFVERINERLEIAEISATKAANKVPRANAQGQLEYDLKGNVIGNLTGTATKATNVAGGAAGSIPYQTAEDKTAFLAKGTLGQIMTYGVLTEAGDASNQLSGWSIAGATDENTNAGVLYWKLTNSGTTRTVDLYKNSDGAAGNKVATGSQSGDGSILLAEANVSGLSGNVTVAYTVDDTDLANNTLTIEAKLVWVDPDVHTWVEPGDTVLLEALTERNTLVTTPGITVKEFQLLRPGRYRLTCDLRSGSGGYIVTANIFSGIEGEALGSVSHTGDTNWTPKTIDLKAVFIRDRLIVKFFTSSAACRVYIRNVRVKYQDAATTPASVVTD